MNSTMRLCRSELKLNAAQMKATGESTELLKKRQSLLKTELSASREKTVLLNSKLTEAERIFGKNSTEAKRWGSELNEAKTQQQAIQNELGSVTAKINEQTSAEKQLADSLSQTNAKMKLVDQELQLNEAKLEGASDKTELLKERQKLLGDQSTQSAGKVKALEQALEQCGKEAGENSDEYAELKSKLVEAKTEQQAIQNEIQNTTKELKEQKTQLQLVGDGFKNAGDGFDKAGQSLKGVSTAAAGALAGSGASAIQFESAFAGVKKTVDEVYDANGKCTYSYQQLEDGIRSMAKEIPASTTEIAGVAETAGQLGIKTPDILGFTRVMVDMGNSTNLASGEAAESIAKFANITGLAADQSMSAEEKYSKIGSTIVDLGNNYATTEADIMAMAQNLASAGEQVGMSESDILALATSLSSVGMEAQAGGTAFSKALIAMQLAVETNSDELKQWADVAGMSASEFSTLFKKDATGALQAFIQGLSECGGETDSAIKVLDDMGITETKLRDSLLRSANASDIFNSAIQTGKSAWEENTALSEEAGKRYETTASKLSIMKNNIVDVGRTLGSTFLPIINDGIEKVVGFAEKLDGMSSSSQKTLVGILAFVAVLSPLLIGLGKVSTGISGIIAVGSKISGLFSGIGTAATSGGTAAAAGMSLPLLPILGVITGIVALIGIFVLLWTKSESFRTFFTGMWEGLKTTVGGFLESINFGDKIDAIKEKFSGLGEKLPGLENLFKVIGTVAAIILVPALAVAAGIFSGLLNVISSLLTAVGGVIDLFSGLGNVIVGVFTGDMELAVQGLQQMKSGISSIFNGLWGAVSGALNGFKSGVVSLFKSLLSACGIDSFVQGIVTKITGMGTKAVAAVKSGVSKIKSGFSGLTAIPQTIGGIFDKIPSKIKGAIDKAVQKVKSGVKTITSALKFNWSLPKLKLPHFSVSGKFSLNPPSIPKFNVKWYAKGAIFKKPTILDTLTGYKGVGEAGAEAIAPISNLIQYVKEAVDRSLFKYELGAREQIDYDKLAYAMSKQPVIMELNKREVGRAYRGATT